VDYGLYDTLLKIYGPKTTLSKVMDLRVTPRQVKRLHVHFTLNKITEFGGDRRSLSEQYMQCF